MKKFLVLLGMPRCATSWLNRQVIALPGVNVMPRKEINYFQSQYGPTNRLTDGLRFRQFQAYVGASKLVTKAEAPKRRDGDGGRRAKPGWLAETDPDPQGHWGNGGVYRKRHRKLQKSLDWYMRYTSGPVNDDWYRGLHADAGDEDWCVDFSPSNGMVNDAGFARMAGFAETTKAILILRHPLDRLWSHIRLAAEKPGQPEAEHPANWSRAKIEAYVAERQLLDRSLYGAVVQGTLRHFAPQNRMILNYEDIAADPRGVLEELAGFLGVAAPPRSLQALEPRDTAARNVRRAHPLLASYVAPCLGQLQEVRAMGIDMVDPWIADLEQAQSPAGANL